MSEPVVTDPALDAIAVVVGALQDAYRPGGVCPPQHPTTEVHFFAGEGPATAAFDAHTDQPGCEAPFLWVRATRRYRTRTLPEPAAGSSPCDLPRAIAVEVGVARCAVTAENPTWAEYEAEAVLSLEDSWRIEAALCATAKRLRGELFLDVTTDPIEPYGPEGGILAWTALLYIQFA